MSSINNVKISGIPAIYVEPATPARRSLVIWLPGFSGSKETVQDQLVDLARLGNVALSFDPYQHGRRRVETLDALRTRIHGNI